MKLTILADNKAVIGRGEWGFSAHLEDAGLRLLFDVGETNLFQRNAALLGIDLTHLDYLVISHGHHDHIWGLPHLVAHYLTHPELRRPTIVAHPEAFLPRMNDKGAEIGSLLGEADLSRRFPLQLSAEPRWLTERVVWLGQISRGNDFEAPEKPGKILRGGDWQTDLLIDDSALAIKTRHGLIVLTGCSHSGICNIIEQAIQVTGERRILDVVGGTHLIQPSAHRMTATLDYLQSVRPQELHAGHCTSLAAKIRLAEVAPLQDMYVGLSLEYQP